MTVKIGDRAVYLPRVPYGRQSELFCFVSRVVDAERGIVDIITFPADGELQRINNVMPKSDGIQVHCWVPREEDSRIAELEERIALLEARPMMGGEIPQIERMRIAQDDLHVAQATRDAVDASDALEPHVKRGPGRPRKDAA